MMLTVDYINRRVREDITAFVAESERRYHDEIWAIVDAIKADSDNKIIMIAGPSGSGKTTTAYILCDCLSACGKHTEVVSLDDFYLNRGDSPRDSEGNLDFESVEALDIPEIRRCFGRIIDEGECDMPIFDFESGRRKSRRKHIDVRGGGLLIVEGLHALNPMISEPLPKKNLFKVYISVSRSICDSEGKTVLSSRQMRLIRRMSRDSIYRAIPPQETYEMWKRVLRGEEKYLYGFKPTADRVVATLHEYEPCVFKNTAISLLSQISPDSEDYDYVRSTARSLELFSAVNESVVPDESLLREFIKGGKYE